MGMKIKAFHGNQSVKEFYVKRVHDHRITGTLIQGTYWDKEQGHGCAVGCIAHDTKGSQHAFCADELGIPIILVHLLDRIFEGLPVANGVEWAENFLAVIPVGADLSQVWTQFALWLLIEPEYGIVKYLTSEEEKRVAQKVILKLRGEDNFLFDETTVKEEIDVLCNNSPTLSHEVAIQALGYIIDTMRSPYWSRFAAGFVAWAAFYAPDNHDSHHNAAAHMKQVFILQAARLLELLSTAPVAA